jgi:calcium-dependent protein kinase
MYTELLEAVQYLHQSEIIHRDIKPNNIVVRKRSDGTLSPVLIDFGVSTFCKYGQKIAAHCGTAGYMAPEIFRRSYDHRADVFSCGVVLYEMLSGTSPFGVSNTRARNQAGLVSYKAPVWNSISADARRLAKKCTQQTPDARWSVKEALSMTYVITVCPSLENGETQDELESSTCSSLNSEAYLDLNLNSKVQKL